jgi:hypothetical protein
MNAAQIIARVQTAFISSSPIESANRNHLIVALLYVASLFLVAVLSLLLWTSGNKVHEAVRDDANARIREADSKAEVAKEGAAKANENAAKADERASKANEEAGRANESAGRANERAATLEMRATEAQKEVAHLQIEAATARKGAADALSHLEELSEALAPRIWTVTGDSEEELRLFAGQKAFIVYSPRDEETRDLAGQIAGHLPINPQVKGIQSGGGWELLGISEADPQLMAPAPAFMGFGGVYLLTKLPKTRLPEAASPWDYPSLRAATILCGQLRDSKIACEVETPTTGQAWPKFLDERAVLIKVARKPDYWMAKVIDQYTKQYREHAPGNILKILDEQATQRQTAIHERDIRERAERKRIVAEELARRSRERQNE